MKNKVDKLLKELAIYYGDDKNKTNNSIYYFLTRYNIPQEDKNFKVNTLFSEWIRYFQNKPNIKVFVSPNWKYFCQFVNYPSQNQPLNNAIKIYLHIGSKDILEVAKILFDFLSANNICHISKIGSDIRLDDIVIRVYSKEDYFKIKNFINQTPKIKNAMQDSFPIGFHDDKINLALDRDMSFNEVTSDYLYYYIVDCKKEKQNVSYQSFLDYVSKIYFNVFIKKNKEDIDLFLKRFSGRYYSESQEYQLNNFHEITRVILESLTENTFENYLRTVDFCNNQQLIKSRVQGYSDILNPINITESDYSLIEQCVLVMCKKYGIEQTVINLNIFLNTGNFNKITRDYNLRSRFIKSMPLKKFKKILGQESIQTLVDDIVYGKAKIILDMAILETYRKYGYDQVEYAVIESMNENYDYFTNDNNARSNLRRNVTKEQITYIVKSYGNISEYITNVLSKYEYNNNTENKTR